MPDRSLTLWQFYMDGYVSYFANRTRRRIALSLLVQLAWISPCHALVSTNVPVGHWSYDAVAKLADYGFIDSAMLTVKPLTRVEMARHISQAMHALARESDPPAVLLRVLDRLKGEFKVELIQIGALDGWCGDSFVKPVEDPYFKYVRAQHATGLENLRGDEFEAGSNQRVGFASRGTFFDRAAFYLHPEYTDASSEGDGDVDLVEAYGKVGAGDYEVQMGKDSLWWGPGRHGSILMSNNAQPLRMIKIGNPQPIQLPWIFDWLGPFKGQWFMAELERDRDIPEARLSGVRLNAKPHPQVELGASRLVMFGGRGVPRVDFFDYVKAFFALTEQEENNQLAGFDVSVLVPLGRDMPLRSVKLYADAAGEDEAGGYPSKWGSLLGAQFNDILRTGRTDLRVEYTDTHELFYLHSLYTSGYTYKGRVMGHYVGTDARSLFVQLSHYVTDNAIVDVAVDRRTYGTSAETQSRLNVIECNLTLFATDDWQLKTGYRYEDGSGELEDNHLFQFQLIREF